MGKATIPETPETIVPVKVDDEFLFGVSDSDVQGDSREYGSVYPVMVWINGTAKGAKGTVEHAGGFFADEESGLTMDELGALGFVPHVHVTNEGNEISGFAALSLKGFVIESRRFWTVDNEGDLRQVFGQDEYDIAAEVGAPRGNVHVLMVLRGAESLGPIMLTFRGHSAGRVASGGVNAGILSRLGTKVVMRYRQLARQEGKGATKIPLLAFSVTIGGTRDADGLPVFTQVGQGQKVSSICMPSWLDEPKGAATKHYLASIFCGPDLFGALQAHEIDAQPWRAKMSSETLSARRAARSGKGQEPKGDLPASDATGF